MRLDDDDLKRMNRVLRHRLRNAASGVKSAVSFLEKEVEGRLAPEYMEYFPLMLKECDSISELTGRLNLLFDPGPPGEPVDVADLLSDLARHMAERFPGAPLKAACSAAAGAARVASGTCVLTALREVVANAVEAAPGAEVHLDGDVAGEYIEFRVTDGATRHEATEPEEFFKPFFTTRTRHAGVGLPVARASMERLGGGAAAAWVPTGGLTVTLRAPCTMPASVPDKAVAGRAAGGGEAAGG